MNSADLSLGCFSRSVQQIKTDGPRPWCSGGILTSQSRAAGLEAVTPCSGRSALSAECGFHPFCHGQSLPHGSFPIGKRQHSEEAVRPRKVLERLEFLRSSKQSDTCSSHSQSDVPITYSSYRYLRLKLFLAVGSSRWIEGNTRGATGVLSPDLLHLCGASH